MLTGREANKYHVERNRNLDDVVDRESIIAMTGFNGGIATSPITYSPPFQRGKHIIEEPSGAEYRTVASISTRNIGPLHFIMQIAKTLRSLIQMRYASGPEHIKSQHAAHAGVYSQVVLKALLANVEAGGKSDLFPV
jgi:hypothetical protein